MKSSIEHFEKACEILKSRNIEPVRHFSPYDEGGEYISGSALQIFWDKEGIEYRFLFDREGKCTWSSVYTLGLGCGRQMPDIMRDAHSLYYNDG